MRCDQCRFWRVSTDNDDVGECRRYPPALDVASVLIGAQLDKVECPSEIEYQYEPMYWVWPHTHGYDFCGEFQSGTTRLLREIGLPTRLLRICERCLCHNNRDAVALKAAVDAQEISASEYFARIEQVVVQFTLDDLCRLTAAELLTAGRCGETSIRQIRRHLRAIGHDLS